MTDEEKKETGIFDILKRVKGEKVLEVTRDNVILRTQLDQANSLIDWIENNIYEPNDIRDNINSYKGH